MIEKLPLRKDVPTEMTWDLTRIYQNPEEFEEALRKLQSLSTEFKKQYQGQLTQAAIINQAILKWEEIQQIFSHAGSYAYLAQSVDQTDTQSQKRTMKFNLVSSKVSASLSFFESELKQVDQAILEQAIESAKRNKTYLADIIRSKPHQLSAQAEELLAALSPVLEVPSDLYEQAKLADMPFADFEVEGKTYPNSFVLFENTYQLHPDTKLRRAAFEAFSQSLKNYQNTIATAYNAQIQKEKVLSEKRNFKSVFDYLLFDQKVERSLYDRQIDLIMEKLAPPMRRYAKLLQKKYNLEEMTFADLKAPLDPADSKTVTLEEAKTMVKEALSVMGPAYSEMVEKAFSKRWFDFAQNVGKSTGGFCASPYQKGSFILLSWSEVMSEVFTIAHELGHAGHFKLAQQNQSILEEDPSLYFIEAPSTMNEMLLTQYFMKKEQDPAFRRYVIGSMIANTYYHNFVTHLLEAAYQREVYRLVDQGEGLEASRLSAIKRQVLESFWGDAVIINEGAELTWMRQPHYYNGLYSYTYSAGLTVATMAAKRIEEEGQPAIEDWLEVLKAGATKTPTELAAMAKVDIRTDQPLLGTIAYIDSMVTELERLSDL